MSDYTMSCDQCGATFGDGIDAGHHEIDNQGHSVRWSKPGAFLRGLIAQERDFHEFRNEAAK